MEVNQKQEEFFEWLKPVSDPELHMSLVELGLIYNVEYNDAKEARVKMTLTSPGCPAGDFIVQQIKERLEEHPLVEKAFVEIVWEPKWDPKEMASDEIKDKLGLW